MTNLESILKSRDITLTTKVHLVKAMVFPAVMYRCESWTIKKAERRRIDAFELWCWRRLLRVPWTARRSNQPILKESVLDVHWKDWCWSWNSNTLATSCEELTHWKRPWCWEGLGAEGEGDDRGWDGWMASPTQWTWVWVNSGSWWWTGSPVVLWFMGLQRVGHDWMTELNWTEHGKTFESTSWLPGQQKSYRHWQRLFFDQTRIRLLWLLAGPHLWPMRASGSWHKWFCPSSMIRHLNNTQTSGLHPQDNGPSPLKLLLLNC